MCLFNRLIYFFLGKQCALCKTEQEYREIFFLTHGDGATNRDQEERQEQLATLSH